MLMRFVGTTEDDGFTLHLYAEDHLIIGNFYNIQTVTKNDYALHINGITLYFPKHSFEEDIISKYGLK